MDSAIYWWESPVREDNSVLILTSDWLHCQTSAERHFSTIITSFTVHDLDLRLTLTGILDCRGEESLVGETRSVTWWETTERHKTNRRLYRTRNSSKSIPARQGKLSTAEEQLIKRSVSWESLLLGNMLFVLELASHDNTRPTIQNTNWLTHRLRNLYL